MFPAPRCLPCFYKAKIYVSEICFIKYFEQVLTSQDGGSGCLGKDGFKVGCLFEELQHFKFNFNFGK